MSALDSIKALADKYATSCATHAIIDIVTDRAAMPPPFDWRPVRGFYVDDQI